MKTVQIFFGNHQTFTPVASCLRLFISYHLFVVIFFSLMFCNKEKPLPVYALDQKVLIDGSVYYSEAGCARCHGVSYKGDGPDSKSLQDEKGFLVPDLTRALLPKVTPLDYFKTITMGTEKFKEHAYQNYTDRGRWAMAYYLYSLSPDPENSDDKKIRALAISSMRDEVEKVYAKTRRWEMGYTPIDKRSKSPELEELLPKQFK